MSLLRPPPMPRLRCRFCGDKGILTLEDGRREHCACEVGKSMRRYEIWMLTAAAIFVGVAIGMALLK